MKWIAPFVLALAIDPVAAASAPATEPAPSYFPPGLSARPDCPPTDWLSREAILSPIWNEAYSRLLRAAGEPSLASAGASLRPGAKILRFTWMRSFHPPVVVRVELPASGVGGLVARTADGSGPGFRTIDRKLTAAETARVRRLLADNRWTTRSAVNCDAGGLDGAGWMLERVDGAGYHFTDRWSPQDGFVRSTGLALLDLTGWTFKDIY